ncbi:unnamed protein product [Choristocarpus tenellus]
MMEVKKSELLTEVTQKMDTLSPSLRSSSTISTSSSSSPLSVGKGGISAPISGEGGTSVVERCVSAALSTGVDCVLAEEYASKTNDDKARQEPKMVPHHEIEQLYFKFQLPS